jgi:hypothetical protein
MCPVLRGDIRKRADGDVPHHFNRLHGYPLSHRRNRYSARPGGIDDRSLGFISHSLQRSDDVVERTIDQGIWCRCSIAWENRGHSTYVAHRLTVCNWSAPGGHSFWASVSGEFDSTFGP